MQHVFLLNLALQEMLADIKLLQSRCKRKKKLLSTLTMMVLKKELIQHMYLLHSGREVL